MSPGGAALWKQWAPGLAARGSLDALDVPAFVEVCETLAMAEQARLLVQRAGVLVKGERGVVKNPALQAWRDLAIRGWALAARFPLTPLDRSRLNFGQPEAPQTVIYEDSTGARRTVFPDLERVLGMSDAEWAAESGRPVGPVVIDAFADEGFARATGLSGEALAFALGHEPTFNNHETEN